MIHQNLFSKAVWSHFLHIDGIHNLTVSAVLAADCLLDTIQRTGVIDPSASDYAMWALDAAQDDPSSWLQNLGEAASLILPSETKKIAAAQALVLNARAKPARASRAPAGLRETPWDPCKRPDGTLWPRKVSVRPWNLPECWQTALRRAARGLPGKMVAAPARDILERTREKLCQLSWSAQKAGLVPDLTELVVHQYLQDLETRLRARDHGIRWSTLRATVEDLYRFSRYLEASSEEGLAYLRKRFSRYELLEKGQDALKFAALLETGNTTLGLLDQADALLDEALQEDSWRSRHRLRNNAAILGLYSLVPLRNADAELILGETLLWESGTWVVDTEIRKTQHRSPHHLVVPLEPMIARYVDAVVQGDFKPRHLPELREKAVRCGRPLILHPNGSRPEKNHIARMFKKQTGNSFTTTRTMLHSDQAVSRGEAGTRDAMAAAHQTSPRTAKKYQEKRVRQAAITRVQDAAATRRAALLSPDHREELQALSADEAKQE